MLIFRILILQHSVKRPSHRTNTLFVFTGVAW